MMDLSELARYLTSHPAVVEKAVIHQAYGHALEVSGNVRLGDDCAAIPNPTGTGHLLFAAEGMLESFVEDDPWFAGYSAVMVNLSDIAAMGGRPVALTDILWTPSDEISSQIWDGMQEAARAYGVPIVGGHTTHTGSGKAALGAAVLGHAGDRLITSFDAKPGDHLVIAIDMHGGYRGDKPFWNSSTTSSPERLRAGLEMLPALAEKGLCRAGKDISNGGIIGTLAMFCNCSEVGAILDLEDLPCPMDVEIERWLVSFPSFGYLLAISPEDMESTLSHFTASRITCREIGHFKATPGITITADGDAVELIFSPAAGHAVNEDFTVGRKAV
jgi:AIR synthase-related protein